LEDFNIKPKNLIQPAKGKLLIAEPFMQDPYFKRTVVLLCEHNGEGTFGFILNRYIDFELSEILEGIPEFETRVGLGGPVESTNLYYLHTLGEELEGSIQISGNIYLGGNFEQLKLKIMSNEIRPSEIRFFVGYSGWGNEQLDNELKEESWYVTEINGLEFMNTAHEELWSQSLINMGGEYANLVHYPADPNLN